MRKVLMLALASAIIPTSLLAQAPRQQQQQQRRQLEAQIVERFLNHAATELKLDAATRARLEEHLRQTAPGRRNLAHQTVLLRGRMLRAVRDSATADAEFTRMINEMTSLRDQEEALWKADQEALRRMLTPRQHARFMVMWLRFNEQVREMLLRRGGAQGPGPRRR